MVGVDLTVWINGSLVGGLKYCTGSTTVYLVWGLTDWLGEWLTGWGIADRLGNWIIE